jgi:IPT/TIG domain/Putative Ig domain
MSLLLRGADLGAKVRRNTYLWQVLETIGIMTLLLNLGGCAGYGSPSSVQANDATKQPTSRAPKGNKGNADGSAASLQITTNSLPTGQESASYAVALTARGGTLPYTWSILSGSLPPGLALGAATGAIAGMPSASGQYSFTVQVTDPGSSPQSASHAFTISIAAAAAATSPLQITTSSLSGGQLGLNYSATLAAANGVPPYTWSNTGGQWPPGLALQASTGQISGNPTQAGAFGFLVQAKDSSGQTASSNFSVVIAPASAPTVGSVSPNSGSTAGGTSVTISGTNFQAGASVVFGGVAASSATVSSATRIQAVTPAHAAGPVDVVVRNPDGQSSIGSFVYNIASPTVASVSPNSGPATGGTSVFITGANFLAGALVFFGGAPATTVTVSSATQIQALTPASTAGAVDVTVENPDGQSRTLASGFTYTAPPPVGTPTITTVSPNSGAPGTQVTVNGTNFASGAAVTFGGTSAASTVFVSATQLTASVPAIGTGIVDVKVTNPGGSSVTLPSGFTITAPQSLLAGMTPSNFTVPAGWTLARTENFESGSLPSDEDMIGSISTNNSHTGSRSLEGAYGGDGQRFAWFLGTNTGVINSRHVYLSWYEFRESQGRFNDEYQLARFFKQDSNYNLIQEEIVDFYTSAPTNSGFNSTSARLVFVPQGSPPGVVNAFYGPFISGGWGVWNQWEVEFQANDPGLSNGILRVHLNGTLQFSLVNQNFNGTIDMTNQIVEIGDTYTKLTWYDPVGSTTCATAIGNGTDSGPRVTNFNNPCPCANQCPSSGLVPIFKRYIDDIIVLKRQ